MDRLISPAMALQGVFHELYRRIESAHRSTPANHRSEVSRWCQFVKAIVDATAEPYHDRHDTRIDLEDAALKQGYRHASVRLPGVVVVVHYALAGWVVTIGKDHANTREGGFVDRDLAADLATEIVMDLLT